MGHVAEGCCCGALQEGWQVCVGEACRQKVEGSSNTTALRHIPEVLEVSVLGGCNTTNPLWLRVQCQCFPLTRAGIETTQSPPLAHI